jgi:hypothetical protein
VGQTEIYSSVVGSRRILVISELCLTNFEELEKKT